VFTQIYKENLWGNCKPHADKEFPFYSGPGSAEPTANPYAECVRQFIELHGVGSVVDLGCGDFRVGSRIVQPSIHYIGIDIVEALVQANVARFGDDDVEFRCLDIIKDELPEGDLCLLREVAQHLSNAQILQILPKLKAFRWVIVTESLPGPVGSFKSNRDKPHGREARVVLRSGIVLTDPPFNVPSAELLLEVPAVRSAHVEGERASTFLLSN
jgi:SAM-dependent methyltransferase